MELALIVGLAVFTLYAFTLAPTTAWWDASEYITTGHMLGIPHPPGNPLFVSIARVWSLMLAPLGLPVAVRINLLAAATSATATFFFFLIEPPDPLRRYFEERRKAIAWRYWPVRSSAPRPTPCGISRT